MNGKHNLITTLALVLLMLALGLNGLAWAQEPAPQAGEAAVGSAFTYQGQLQGASGPVTSTCDFNFSLWDALTGGAQVGTTQTKTNVVVNDGMFTAELDFGTNAFAGSARWLEISVRCPAGNGSYTTLVPRQALRPTPYALFSTNADLLDGLHASSFQQHYQNLIVVAKSGGDFTSIQAALDSITTASDASRYLVWVAPGVYTEMVTMKPYVDIEGAGELLTTISYTGSEAAGTGSVVGSSDAELRFLTVRNTGGDYAAIAIFNNDASPRLTHITASASGGTSNIAVFNTSSSPAMRDVTCVASGGSYAYGVYNSNYSSPAMATVTASALDGQISYGLYNVTYSSPTMKNVTASASGGQYNYGVYNYNYSSPAMTDVNASASGGYNSYGVYNNISSPAMTNLIVNASGATHNYGIVNMLSSPELIAVNITATGETSNYGMWNEYSSLTIQNSVIRASGGTNDGLHNIATTGSYVITINASQITGGTSTIYQDSQYTTKVGASQLAGGGVFGGTYVCAASYNGNYTALNSSCQP